ncbi:MAG: DsbA family protein [Anderseniella sp.]|jgi:protein-disulfide isomerase|nr:DsbA family protein [Anderseniella sp.]
MRKTITAGVLAMALAATTIATPLSAVAAEDQFNNTQKNELHNIIREYLLENPQILNEMIEKLQVAERQQQEERAKAAISTNADNIFRSPHDIVVGNPDGNVTVVEFFDYNCGYCKRSMADVLRMTEEDKDVRIVLKEFPILSEGSVIAAHAALAARKQDKSWELHLALMGAQGSIDGLEKVLEVAKEAGLDVDKLQADMEAERAAHDKIIDETRNLAQELGINGTPAFIIDNQLVPGAAPYEQLMASVKNVRDAGGCKYC